MNDKEKSGVILLAITVTFFLMPIISSCIPIISNYIYSDSEYDVTIVDKRIEYTDDGIEMYHITYRVEEGINQGLIKDSRCSGRVYYRCEVGKKYHVLIQSNGVWKSWHETN